MKQMKIGKSGIEVSVVALGAWAIGGDANWGPSDDSESIRTIKRAGEMGITLVDSAPAYGLGHSEEVIGRALEGHRHDYIIATKCGIRWDTSEGAFFYERDGVKIVRNSKPDSIAMEVEQSLRRLKTDYIDIYIVHWQSVPEFPVPISETMEFLMKLKKEGKIRAIGASNLEKSQFEQYIKTGRLDIIQEKYSMLDRIKGEEFFGLCDENGVTFQCYSPLERGILTGKYKLDTPVNMARAKNMVKWYQKENLIKIVALADKWRPLCEKYCCTMGNLVVAWTTARGNGSNINVIVGARTIAHVEENAKGGSVTISGEDQDVMLKDVQAIS
jgi:methylglyoxal reductase